MKLVFICMYMLLAWILCVYVSVRICLCARVCVLRRGWRISSKANIFYWTLLLNKIMEWFILNTPMRRMFAYIFYAKIYDVRDNIKMYFKVFFIGGITEFKFLLYLSLTFNMLIVLQVNLSIWLFLIFGIEIMVLEVSQKTENMNSLFVSKQ